MAFSFRTLIAGGLLVLSLAVQADDQPKTVRPEVGKALQAAQSAIDAKDYASALAKTDEASGVEKLTPYEAYAIARTRASAALGAAQDSLAFAAYQAVLASPEMPETDRLPVLNALTRLSYAAKDYAKAADYARSYRAAGGTDAQISLVLAQALYLSDDYAGAQQELLAQFAAMQASGQAPPELQLKLYLSCAVKQDDKSSYRDALRRLVEHYPSSAYWQELITHTVAQADFPTRLTLDMYRLKEATGTIDNADEYNDAAQLALQAGFPGEARRYVEQGYAKGLLGVGAKAGRDQSLKALVAAKLADDQRTLAEGERAAAARASGDALVATGLNYVGYGQYDKGIALIEQGIAKGKLKQADEATLHLAYAQMRAGKLDAAHATLKTISGDGGSAELARLWLLVKPTG